jgi:hypothetical protein
MAEIERITPPLPTLPTPVGRNVGSKRRRTPRDGGEPGGKPRADVPAEPNPDSEPIEHIDEYV